MPPPMTARSTGRSSTATEPPPPRRTKLFRPVREDAVRPALDEPEKKLLVVHGVRDEGQSRLAHPPDTEHGEIAVIRVDRREGVPKAKGDVGRRRAAGHQAAGDAGAGGPGGQGRFAPPPG